MNLFKVVVASKLFKSLSAKSNLQTMVMKGLPAPTSPTKLKFRLKRDGRDYREDSEKSHSRPQRINYLCGIWVVRLSSPHKTSPFLPNFANCATLREMCHLRCTNSSVSQLQLYV